MKQDKQQHLGRKRFLALLGSGALGAWLFQIKPFDLAALMPKWAPRVKRPHKHAKRVVIHSLAVKRNERG